MFAGRVVDIDLESSCGGSSNNQAGRTKAIEVRKFVSRKDGGTILCHSLGCTRSCGQDEGLILRSKSSFGPTGPPTVR